LTVERAAGPMTLLRLASVFSPSSCSVSCITILPSEPLPLAI
jgi:hypothetical protein